VALASPGIGIADDPPPEPTPTAAVADAPAPRAPEPPPQPDHRAEGPVLAIGEAGTRVRFGASAHTDARAYFGNSVAPSSFDIRRARFDLRGGHDDWLDIRIQAALEGSPYVRNAWAEIRPNHQVAIRVGQMKVPFSTSWLTTDNEVNFVERATSTPVTPFFDRGVMLWGRIADDRLTWQTGLFNGSGIDADTGSSDIDDHKDVVLRFFGSPWRSGDRGLFAAVQAIRGQASVATRRFETSGMRTPTYESLVWRWRTEQLLASNSHASDRITADVGRRDRLGAELHLVNGPLSTSLEWLEVTWSDITIFHEYLVGNTPLVRDPVMTRSGSTESVALWASLFLTGEHKRVDAFGWRQPDPIRPWTVGSGGSGAWELLLRVARTRTSPELFDEVRVSGFTDADLPEPGLPTVGAGASVRAAVLDGASTMWEVTAGLSWTLDHHARLQLNLTSLWAVDQPTDGGGILSGGASDIGRRHQTTESERETAATIRLIVRL
jgi:phosphate-selective porin